MATRGCRRRSPGNFPRGFKAGPIQWPLPDKIVSPGDIINYGYSRDVMLLVQIIPPAILPPGDVTLKAKADWLVCRESCIPGSKELALILPVASGEVHAANAELFNHYRQLLPMAATADGRVYAAGRDRLARTRRGRIFGERTADDDHVSKQPWPPNGKAVIVKLISDAPPTFYDLGRLLPAT